jgi:hypothetical protein
MKPISLARLTKRRKRQTDAEFLVAVTSSPTGPELTHKFVLHQTMSPVLASYLEARMTLNADTGGRSATMRRVSVTIVKSGPRALLLHACSRPPPQRERLTGRSGGSSATALSPSSRIVLERHTILAANNNRDRQELARPRYRLTTDP